jgi:formate dehydrogenase iron-sulfur subunit
MKSLLIDSTLCIDCKACQVACKNWHALPAEKQDTVPQKLTGTRLTLVSARTENVNGSMKLLFFKDQCRHCQKPRCVKACPLEAIDVDPNTGAVYITGNCNPTQCVTAAGKRPCEDACLYHIPRFDPEANIDRKCDLCYDRISDDSGRNTACADACPTGALFFGEAANVRIEAGNRLNRVKLNYPSAVLYTGSYAGTRVIWLLVEKPSLYGI